MADNTGKNEQPPGNLIGVCEILLQPLSMLLNIDEDAPVTDLSGQQIGKLHVNLELGHIGAAPVANFEQRSSTRLMPREGESVEEQWAPVNFAEHKGEKLQVNLRIGEAHTLSGAAAQGGVFLRCLTDIQNMKTEGVQPIVIEPAGGVRGPELCLKFDYSKLFEPSLSKSLQDWFSLNTLELEIWGTGSIASPLTSPAGPVDDSAMTALRAENERLKAELERATELAKKQNSKTCQIS